MANEKQLSTRPKYPGIYNLTLCALCAGQGTVRVYVAADLKHVQEYFGSLMDWSNGNICESEHLSVTMDPIPESGCDIQPLTSV